MFWYKLGKFDTLVDSGSCGVECVLVFDAWIVCISDWCGIFQKKVLTSLSGSSIGKFSIDIRILSS